MEVRKAFLLKTRAGLGGDGGGQQFAGLRIVVQAVEMRLAEFDAGECVDLDEAFDWLEARYARPA